MGTSHIGIEHLYIMGILMFAIGLVTTMNLYVDRPEDIKLSLNDIYMSGVMSGLMVGLMGLYYGNTYGLVAGLVLAGLGFWALRTQLWIGPTQYLRGMIPHHSMAMTMSKKLLENEEELSPELRELAQAIIGKQEEEIKTMKDILDNLV